MTAKPETTVTFRFEGTDHLNAADALFVATLAGGLDDEIKRRLAKGGISIDDIAASGLREIVVKLKSAT